MTEKLQAAKAAYEAKRADKFVGTLEGVIITPPPAKPKK